MIALTAGAVFLVIWKFGPSLQRSASTQSVARVGTPIDENASVDFERSDLPLAPIAGVYLAALALLVLCVVVLMFAYPNAMPDVNRTLRIAPPGPLLQTDPAGDLRVFRAEEDKRLNTYYWIDKSKGVVHIPIEQAMKQLTKSGIGGFPKAAP